MQVENIAPVTTKIPYKDNLKLADVMAIAAMKMEVMMRRSNFRDYYDIYSMLKRGYDFKEMIDKAIAYSGHLLSTKNLLAMLVDGTRFHVDSRFELLEPIYKVTASEIEEYVKLNIRSAF